MQFKPKYEGESEVPDLEQGDQNEIQSEFGPRCSPKSGVQVRSQVGTQKGWVLGLSAAQARNGLGWDHRGRGSLPGSGLGAGVKPRSRPAAPTFGLGYAGGLARGGRFHGAGGSGSSGRD